MRILVSGASGLLGSALVPLLAAEGHTIVRLARRPAPDAVAWDFTARAATREVLEALAGTEAVIHLAGESIAAVRWTEEKKRRIRDSRVGGTRNLVDALLRLNPLPRYFLGASAIGFYGDRGGEVLHENSAPGTGFFPQTCQLWEAASAPLFAAGVNVAHARLGVILTAKGGALPKMLLPFRMGTGGRIGSGEQWLSWIHLEDAAQALAYMLRKGITGACNVAAPVPITNNELTATIARVLNRPALIPLPAFAVRALMGEMGETTLLHSARVVPQRLVEFGFAFRYPRLEEALRAES